MDSVATGIDRMVKVVMAGALRGRGYDERDFELDTCRAPLSDLMGLDDELVTVRRRSTGNERHYASTPDEPWLLGLIVDLDHGHFGRTA